MTETMTRSEFVKLSGVPLSTVGDAIASLKIKTETDSRGRVLLPLSDVQSLIDRLSRNIQPERLVELSERLRTLPEPDLSDLPKAPEANPNEPFEKVRQQKRRTEEERERTNSGERTLHIDYRPHGSEIWDKAPNPSEGKPEPPKVDLPNPTEKREAPEGETSATIGNAFFIAPATTEPVAPKRSTVLSKLIFTSQSMRPYTLRKG